MKRNIIVLMIVFCFLSTAHGAECIQLWLRNKTHKKITHLKLGQEGYERQIPIPVLFRGITKKLKIPREVLNNTLYLVYFNKDKEIKTEIINKDDLDKINVVIISIFDDDKDGEFAYFMSTF